MATKKAAKKSSKKSARKGATKKDPATRQPMLLPTGLPPRRPGTPSDATLLPPIPRPAANPSFICVKGTLTDEGVECQALKGADGKLYTLLGNLKSYGIGDEVVVCGNVAAISFCMQGTTIAITWIGRKATKAKPTKPTEGP